MTIWPSTIDQTMNNNWRTVAGRIALVLFMVAMSIGVIVGWEQFERLGLYGYPAVFFASLLSNLALFLPAPGFAIIFAAGKTLDPVTVGVVAGLGASIAEISGYMVGFSGKAMLDDKPLYQSVHQWMDKSGTLAIFLLAAIPNPIFDMGGLVAGALRMPVWRFLTAAWVGKAIRYAILAAIGGLAL
jgi:membrane protein YqaA with SNARE-associated domain